MSRPPSSTQSTTPVVRTPQGDATQLPLFQFLRDVLPPLPEDVAPTQLVNRLRTQKAITSKGRWRGFADDPAHSWQHENVSFRYLKSAVHSILKASGRASSVSFRQNPNGTLSRDRRDGPFPDTLLLAEEELDWNSVVAVGELHKRDSEEDLQENECKVTASMAKCFYHDPRRRFLYAFTIENTNMRLWFCDRSQIIVSDAFNFITDHEPFIHFFASMMFAKPEDYGLDPTIKRVGNSERYDITVQSLTGVGRTFRTLERVCGDSAELLCGSGTRVWKVTEIKDSEETERTMTLKDLWVEPEQQPEGSIYEQFYRATDIVKRDSTTPSPFLTVECHGDVYSDGRVREVLDCTRQSPHVPSLGNCAVKSRNELLDPATTTVASHPSPKRLVHYRIVFKEVGKSLDREKSLSKIFHALSHAVLALRMMHKIGWVHRAVSPENILVGDDGDFLLGDLQDAKIMDEGEETRVGRSSFMAIEVASQHYGHIFQIGLPATPIRELYPELKDRFEKRAAHIKALRDAMKNPSAPESQAYICRPPSPLHFRYNPLHDLESIWWIAMYFLVKKEIVDPRLDSDAYIASEAQRDYASRLFRHHDHMCRSDTLFLQSEFLKGMQTLPEHVSGFVEGLSFLRDELLEHYTAQEADPSMIDHTCADGLHERFHEMLQNIATAEEISTLVVRPFTYVPHSSPENDNHGWRPFENAPGGSVPWMWRPYRGHGFYTPSSSRSLKRSISNTPSDPSIDYDQFQEAKRAKLVDPAQAGAENRVRPYLARRAKTRTQNQARKAKARKTKR